MAGNKRKRRLTSDQYFSTVRRYASVGFAVGVGLPLALSFRFGLIPEGFGSQTLFGAVLLMAGAGGAIIADLLLQSRFVNDTRGDESDG